MTSTSTSGPSTPIGADTHHAGSSADEHHACAPCLDRRQLLTRAGGVGLAAAGVAVLAACGSGTGSGGGAAATTGGTDTASGGSAGPLAQVADVPVGGALLVDSGGQKVLLVQADAGTITALSAICTHQGCTVQPAEGDLHCPCHNSNFALDGARISGPADEPLPSVDVHVKDGAVYLGTA